MGTCFPCGARGSSKGTFTRPSKSLTSKTTVFPPASRQRRNQVQAFFAARHPTGEIDPARLEIPGDGNRVLNERHCENAGNRQLGAGLEVLPDLAGIRLLDVATQTLEEKLKVIAQKCGVQIRQREITDPLALPNEPEFKKTKIFIGADSRWSTVRKKIFSDKLRMNSDIAYVAQLKYKVHGQGKPLSRLRYGYATEKLMQVPAIEFVGQEKEKMTNITVQIVIDKKTFNQMETATTGNAYNWHSQRDGIPKQVKRCVEIWLNTKEKIVGEKPVLDSIKVSVIPYKVYSSQTIVKMDEVTNKIWALVGDAAAGLPLMKGLCHGTRCAIRLASANHQHLSDKHATSLRMKGSLGWDAVEGDVPLPYKAYAAYVKNVSLWEAFTARILSLFIRLYGWWIYVSGKVPWQSNKWNEADAAVLVTAHVKTDLD